MATKHSRSNVLRGYGRFRDGREDIEDDPRSGLPTECCSDNNVEKISQMLLQNRQTINAVYYKGVMERLLNRIRRVRPGMCESGDWFLLHDNAPSHNAWRPVSRRHRS
jgi:hypothetical protein